MSQAGPVPHCGDSTVIVPARRKDTEQWGKDDKAAAACQVDSKARQQLKGDGAVRHGWGGGFWLCILLHTSTVLDIYVQN